jgi:hypothetical protein
MSLITALRRILERVYTCRQFSADSITGVYPVYPDVLSRYSADGCKLLQCSTLHRRVPAPHGHGPFCFCTRLLHSPSAPEGRGADGVDAMA